jgi:hypothetical protein
VPFKASAVAFTAAAFFISASLPDTLVLGSNGSWVGHRDQFGKVHYALNGVMSPWMDHTLKPPVLIKARAALTASGGQAG